MIYVIDSPEHPLDVAVAAEGLRPRVASVPVADWGDALTPWPAPALRPGDKDFGGRADETLASLADALDGTPGPHAICGYSLGGLFALYAFVREPRLAACACLSGSVRYEGWVDWLRESAPDCAGRHAYLSVGKKEKRAGLPFRHVEEDLAACADILRARLHGGRGARPRQSHAARDRAPHRGPGGPWRFSRRRGGAFAWPCCRGKSSCAAVTLATPAYMPVL